MMLILLLGLGLKYYYGPASDLVNNSLAGIAYVVFWCLGVKLLFPKTNSLRSAIIVTITTCALEFAQLWHPPFLNLLRSYWLGKTLLGTTFNWTDIPYYFIGGLLGWVLMRDRSEIAVTQQNISENTEQ